MFCGQSPFVGTNFTEGNSERLREQAKETKAVVDFKKPSLPSFSSVEFLVRLRLISFRVVSCVSWAISLCRNQFHRRQRRKRRFLWTVDLNLRSLRYLLFKVRPEPLRHLPLALFWLYRAPSM